MNRREFQGILAALPFLGRLKPPEPPLVYPNWENLTCRYEDCDEEEFKQKLSNAIANHDFQPPIFKEIS